MLIIKFQQGHGFTTAGTFKWVVTEGGSDTLAPAVERKIAFVFFFRDGTVQSFVGITVSGIDTIITNHFKMFFRYMLNEPFYKVQSGDCFGSQLVIFVSIVVKSNRISIVVVNAGSCNDGSTKVTAYIFDDRGRVTFSGFGIDVEPIFVISINSGFHLFKGVTKAVMKFIQKSSLEGITHKLEVEVIDIAPQAGVTDSAFRDKTVDMRIPFKVSAEGVKNTDKAGSKSQGLVKFEEHTKDNTSDRVEKTV